MNNRSNIRNAVRAMEELAENHNIIMSTVDRLIDVTNKNSDFIQDSIEQQRYEDQIELINKLQAILGGTV